MMDNELLTPDFILDRQIQKHCREMHQAPMTKDELRMVRYGIHLASQLAKDEKLIEEARQEGIKTGYSLGYHNGYHKTGQLKALPDVIGTNVNGTPLIKKNGG